MHCFRYIVFGIMLASTLLVTSCTTRSALRLEKLSECTLNNDFVPAAESIKKNPKLYGKTNEFLFNMDIGTLYHYAGYSDSSNAYLLKASAILDELYARSITNEAAAVMVNDNIRPYRSKPYEIVMMHQFLSSNYLANGNIEGALVEARQVQLHFDEWNRKNGKKEEKYQSDGMFNYLSSIVYDAADETSDAMISLYDAVKAFQAGPVLLPGEIRDRAYYMFQMNDRAEDIKLLNLSASVSKSDIPGLENNASEIIFIGYAGRGPVLSEQSWWGTWVKDGLLVVQHTNEKGETETMSLAAPSLPAGELKKAAKGEKTASGTTLHIKFALPAVKTVPSQTDRFSISCSGYSKPVTSIIINDLDKQAQKQLDDTKNTTLLRTVVRVVLRTIAAEKAKEKMQTGSTAANLLLNIGTDILADQLEKADTRSCFLLPKTVQIARIAVAPGTYTVDVAALGKTGVTLSNKTFSNVTVGNHEKKFVFYSSFK